MTKRYPHEAVADVRQASVDEAKAALVDASAALERAEAAVMAARRRIDAHDRETAAKRAAEQGRVGDALDAGDLDRAARYFAARRVERVALVDAQTARTRERDGAAEAANAARDALAHAMAEAKVVEKHRERFMDSLRAKDEAAQELESEDVVQGRRRPT